MRCGLSKSSLSRRISFGARTYPLSTVTDCRGKWLIGKNMMDSTPLPDVPLSNSTRFAFSRDWLKLAVSRVGNLSASRREGKFMNMMKPWKFTLIVLAIVFVACAGLARVGSAAEAIPFLVSYGGTAATSFPSGSIKTLVSTKNTASISKSF